MATLIVSGVLVVALNCVTASRTTRARAADRVRAQELAMDLLSEILQQAYESPIAGTSRASWAEVDDYNGLIDSPPTTKSGTPIPDCNGLSRSVSVVWIDPATLTPSRSSSTGIKRVTVLVKRGTLTLASVAGYRTHGWVDVIPNPSDATANHPPTAAATGNPLTGTGGSLTVAFDGSGSTDPDGNPLSYTWNFGDSGAGGSGPTISHTYAAAGTYNATLTVYDGHGGVGISTLTVTVKP